MHKDVHCFRVMCGTVLRADEALGAGEERTEMYVNTLKEYRSLQQRDSPQATAKVWLCQTWGGATQKRDTISYSSAHKGCLDIRHR